MNGIVLFVAMTWGVSTAQPLSYATARAQADMTRRPLLVLVGANWCPACRVMKHATLSRMREDGQLKNVHYATVDVDAEPQLAAKLMQSSSIPQLVLYAPASSCWYQMRLVGAQDPGHVTAMIEKGLDLQRHENLSRHSGAE